jgi:hypothetical protein
MRTTHRVAQVIERDGTPYFVTKGDANPVVDDWRPSVEQKGGQKWQRGITYGDSPAMVMQWHVPYVGYATVLAAQGWFRLALIAIVTAWLAVVAVRWIWAPTDPPPPIDLPIEDILDPYPDPDPVTEDAVTARA